MSKSIEYKSAVFFILRFLGIYFTLNTCYAIFIEYYAPHVDPLTEWVTFVVTKILSLSYNEVGSVLVDGSAYIPISLSNTPVISIFEGCNGVNIAIVYVSFLIGFGRLSARIVYFLVGGVAFVTAFNLIRVLLLFEVALKSPQQLYFYHKYLFTGILYLITFGIWFLYVRGINGNGKGAASNSRQLA